MNDPTSERHDEPSPNGASLARYFTSTRTAIRRQQEARLWIARAYLRGNRIAHARIELEELSKNREAKRLSGEIAKLLSECQAAEQASKPQP